MVDRVQRHSSCRHYSVFLQTTITADNYSCRQLFLHALFLQDTGRRLSVHLFEHLTARLRDRTPPLPLSVSSARPYASVTHVRGKAMAQLNVSTNNIGEV